MRHLIIGVITLICACSAEARFAEPNNRGVAFGHMHLVVTDLELHKKLWPELFGAELVEKQGYSAVRIADALIFFRDAEPTTSSINTAMDHFGLKVRDLEGVLSKWRALGYEVDSETIDANGRPVAYVTMPGGVRLAVREDPNQPESVAMGHIHFATPIRGELMAWYAEYFGVTALIQNDSDHAATVAGAGLSFDDSETDRLPTDGAAIDHIGFEVQNWDEFVEMLERADIQFEFGPAYIESLDLWVAFFNDPSGVLVEITHGLDQF